MAKVQQWNVTQGDVTHRLVYTRSFWSSKVTLQIDDEVFTLPCGARREPFRLGEEQAILHIRRSGKAQILTREGVVPEV